MKLLIYCWNFFANYRLLNDNDNDDDNDDVCLDLHLL